MAPRGRRRISRGLTREDAARDNMRNFGFAERVITQAIRELRELYGEDGWKLIEDGAYSALFEICLEKQTQADQANQVAEAKNPEVAVAQNQEVADTQNQDMAEAQNQEMAEAQNPVVAEAQNPEVAEAQYQEVAEAKNPEVAEAKNQEVAEVPNEEVTEAPNQEMVEAQNKEVAEAQNPVVAESQNEEMAEAQNQELTEAQNPEMAEVPNEEVAEAPNEEMVEAQNEDVTETINEELALEDETGEVLQHEQEHHVEDVQEHVCTNSTSLLASVTETRTQARQADAFSTTKDKVLNSSPTESPNYAHGPVPGAKNGKTEPYEDSEVDDDAILQLTPEPLSEELQELLRKVSEQQHKRRRTSRWDK